MTPANRALWADPVRRLQTLLAAVFCLWSSLALGQSWLTEQERSWLQAHPVIRYSADPAFAPYSFVNEAGQLEGLSSDYLSRVGAMLDVQFRPVVLEDWAAVVQASQRREIDMISVLALNAEREQWLAFTPIYLPTPLVVITNLERPRMGSSEDLRGMRVALVKGYAASRQVTARFPGLSVIDVDTSLAGLNAVAAGEADAYVGVLGVSLYLINRHGLANLRPNVGFELTGWGQRMAVRKDWSPLAGILGKALAHVAERDRLEMSSRWMPPVSQAALSKASHFAAAETRWLQSAPRIRVGVAPDQSPFVIGEHGGAVSGMSADVLAAVTSRTGLNFEFVWAGRQDELPGLLARRAVDMVAVGWASMAPQARATRAEPYYDSSLLILCRRGQDCLARFEAGQAMKVAVRRGGQAYEQALNRPGILLAEVGRAASALELLADGTVDAALGESRAMLQALRGAEDDVSRIVVGGVPSGAAVNVHMLVRDDWPALRSVLDTVLASLGDSEMGVLRSRWLGVGLDGNDSRVQQALQRKLEVGAFVLTGALALAAWMMWWNRRLASEVGRRREAERSLARARDAAERASLHKSEFVANTSHELRTPLNAIVGMQHLLQDSGLDERQQHLLRVQVTAARSLLSLVNDLLDLARIESGRLDLREAPFELDRLLDDSLAMVHETADGKGLDLRLDRQREKPPTLVGDEERLRQVLVNLLSNAVKYTEHGTVTLRVRVQSTHSAAVARLAVEVIDTGPGIADEFKQRVFEPFQQLGAARHDPAHGVGLGLSIAGQLVAQMGGQLQLDTTLGVGSRFHFVLDLPVAAPDSVPAPLLEVAASPLDQRCRVLVVEDNEVNRMIAREVLQSRGCEVEEAEDGEQALIRLAKAPAPDIVLMDVGLPGIDGFQTIRRLRATPGPAVDVPVIGLTARALWDDRENCLRAGMQDVVLKPFEPDALWARMQQAINAR